MEWLLLLPRHLVRAALLSWLRRCAHRRAAVAAATAFAAAIAALAADAAAAGARG
jgi:hypothetical protein